MRENTGKILAGILLLAGGAVAFYTLGTPAPDRTHSASQTDSSASQTEPAGQDTVEDSVAYPIDGPGEKQPLSPGTVRVRMTLTGMDGDSGSMILSARIDTVLGYGSSTGPLAAGEEVRIRASRHVRSPDNDPSGWETGMAATAILSQAQGMVLGGESRAEWDLVEWKTEEE